MVCKENRPLSFIFLISFSMLALSSCQISRYVFYNFAGIKDHKIFPSRELSNDSVAFTFTDATAGGKAPKKIANGNDQEMSFDHFLEANHTVAFMIIKNDSIQYENYFNGYDRTSVVASFSMAKSVTSILIGCALDDGLIQSVNEPVINYIPELEKNGLERVTIRHLLQMTSGIRFNESYSNPFGDAASFYYGRKLRKRIGRMKPETEPGRSFDYISGNSQLLGLVLERALKTKTVTDYLNEKIWQPCGMEYPATWSIDQKKNGLEKTFCCINARARDFAKIGRLYLRRGDWNGKQLVPAAWVDESTKVDTTEGSAWYYQYQWWLPTKNGDFMARGILGQYIYVNPQKGLIIVRLGKKTGNANWSSVFTSIAEKY